MVQRTSVVHPTQIGAQSEPQSITPAIAQQHRYDWASRIDVNALDRNLLVFPGRSVWVPNDDELLVVGPWRNRFDIASVAEVSAVRRLDELIDVSREMSFRLGSLAFVMPEWNETRPPQFYERNGLEVFEDVLSFAIDARTTRPGDLEGGAPVQVQTMAEPLLDRVLTIDHAAFPWLWQNSRLEFEHYLMSPGVEIWVHHDRFDNPVSYIGITTYSGWGHLDRVAVDPAHQGAGYGQQAVRFAIARLRRLGARRVGLSTQRTNLRSRRLYAHIGFQQTRQNDYRIYGTLAPGAEIDAPFV